MKGLTTKEAFGKVINTRGISHHLGMNENTVRNFRMKFKNGDVVSIDKMEEILAKVGCVVVQEKLWKINLEEE